MALLLAGIVHAPALGTWFAQDDVTFLSRARGLSATPWSLARPLSEGLLWRALHAAFGLNPLPYHLFNLTLHLANVALVFAIGTRLCRSATAGAAAAVLFGVSSIAFTPLHWSSGLVELSVTTFTLAAFWLFLRARARARPALPWIGAGLVLAALTCKESALLLPLVLLVTHVRLEPRGEPAAAGTPLTRPSVTTVLPLAIAAVIYAAGFVLTLERVHYVRSEAYSMSASPAFVVQNLATYLAWIVSIGNPIRDAFAAMHPEALPLGLAVLAALALALWLQRREPRHPAEVGAAWFVAFLAPVVALEHHTYLYYLYLPWAGMCWMIVAFGQRLARGHGVAGGLVALSALGLFTTVEFRNVRTRRASMNGTFPADKTVRESLLLRNVVSGLRDAGVAPGEAIAFVNPAPVRRTSMTDATADSASLVSYVPLEQTLRGGETIRLFFPGVEYLGFARSLPPEWERARILLYQDEGTVRSLGSGSRALAELGYFTLRLRDFAAADSLFQRSLATGDTVADAVFGIALARGQLGRADEFERWGRVFLRRFPDDPRAAVVGQDLQSRSGAR